MDWSLCISGGTLTALGKGKYKVLVPERLLGTADVAIYYHQKKFLKRNFHTFKKKMNKKK